MCSTGRADDGGPTEVRSGGPPAGTAGRTVLFSGLTVAVALAGLTVFPDPFRRSMGLAAVAVVVDMLAALTVLPALLALFGNRIRPDPVSAVVSAATGCHGPSASSHPAQSSCCSRSPARVLLPVKAVHTNPLSIGAALGAVVWVFQQGNLGAENLGGTNLTVPVRVAAIAFDYEVFLLSRIRERWVAGAPASVAVSEGLQRTGRIVTAAALLLAVVFAGFLAGGFVPIRAIGLGPVLAVLLDATVVQTLLVPATMTLLGPVPLRRFHARFAGGFDEAPADSPAPELVGAR